MARQEVIDGPGVVAKILSRFPVKERDRVVAAIRLEAPKVAASIERRMADAPQAKRPSTNEFQSPPQPMYTSDVAPSQLPPQAVPQLVVERVYQPEVQHMEESIASPESSPATEIEAAQSRILRRLEELYPDASHSGERKPFKSRLA